MAILGEAKKVYLGEKSRDGSCFRYIGRVRLDDFAHIANAYKFLRDLLLLSNFFRNYTGTYIKKSTNYASEWKWNYDENKIISKYRYGIRIVYSFTKYCAAFWIWLFRDTSAIHWAEHSIRLSLYDNTYSEIDIQVYTETIGSHIQQTRAIFAGVDKDGFFSSATG